MLARLPPCNLPSNGASCAEFCLMPSAHHYTHLRDGAQCSSSCYNALSMTMGRSLPMSNWVEAELAACQMHDVRHTKRLAQLLGRLSERSVTSICCTPRSRLPPSASI